MKRRVYILMFMALLLFTGCNLFKGIDKEKLSSPEAFNFKIDDAMDNGDYTVVVGMINEKINGSPELKAVDSSIGSVFTSLEALSASASEAEITGLLQEITDYLNTNIGNSSTQEYVDLKLKQAEAYSGEAGVKLTDIIANLTSTTSPNLASLSTKPKSSANAKLTIGDVIPENVVLEKLESASKAYGAAFPLSTGAAFDFLTGKYNSQPYLNIALTHAVVLISHFKSIFNENGSIMTTTSSGFNSEKTTWNNELWHWRHHLITAQRAINLYAEDNPNGLVKKADLDKLNENFSDLLDKINIIDDAAYNDFTSTSGLR